ncbi:MAG TPA: thiamine pyrophosphate-requiring protein [Caulobacteraceae bacterium]|jgi:pyruvate dehydrogenase (quinone)|nr:thiamine pyrophosphate-requiring protein [Caulobacteraceae bacterium]
MSKTVGDFLVERLHDWGVTRIFGYPGDGINGVLGSLQRDKHPIEFVQVRHEEMAAFMACAHAKFTGELGVCLSTGGPGASHMVTGLYDAKLDHMPVLAIVGQAPRTARGAHYQQELNLSRLFSDAAAYVQEVEAPSQVRHVIDRAIRIAIAERKPTVIVMPGDIQEEKYEDPPHKHGSVSSGVGYSRPRIVPLQEDLEKAAAILNAGEKVAILAGAGTLGAMDELIAVADVLGAGAAKALLGKAALPDDLPWVTGPIGYLGAKPSYDLMMECDTLLMVGSGFPYSEFLPKPGKARGVQIDIEPAMLSLRYPMEAPLHGDAAETLTALLPMLTQKTSTDWRDRIAKHKRDWIETLESRAKVEAKPVNPQRVTWELSPQLPSDAIITSDSGSCANWYARDLMIGRGMMCSLSGSLASMGAAVPYAIAAKFAHSGRPVIALVGDGAMQMNNMAELITVAKYWRQWKTPNWICCVFNNEDLNQVTWEQRVTMGNPKFDASQQIPNVPYHRFAELIGLKGIYIDDPEQMADGWAQALACDTPVVLEVKTDPEVPPIPPHITFEEARNLTSALLHRDSREGAAMKGSARQVMSKVLADVDE